ncbi:MAG: diaminopropionate ammonia-lyase [Candidatus Puniceispirillum sp.]|nr:diaminopropionate ammonia-lyase [Candidatus Puniceispirillum sp.]MBL6775453.1 diaminopropionate ammonia-lyase [Candidatus Puniceispirillum sp.]
MPLDHQTIEKCKIVKAVANRGRIASAFPEFDDNLNSQNMDKAYAAITDWPHYQPTPLISLDRLAKSCGVGAIYYKDESKRLDLKSFKALGGAYAVANLVATKKSEGIDPANITVTTATDGNHGRSVAWGAKQAGCDAEIYIHEHVSQQRADAMAVFGANINRIIGNYEASLAACKADAEAHGRYIVSDTSWPGYREMPLDIMAGYSVMGRETLDQMQGLKPTHCFLPIGVGGMAAGIVAPLWRDMGASLGKMIGVESYMSACFLDSIEAQMPSLVDISEETLMAGLSCGEISDLAWQILQPTLHHCLSITDDAIAPLMTGFADGRFGGGSIEAGECSTAGLAAFLAAKNDPAIWQALGLGPDSIVLLIGTEGATDPVLYQQLLNEGQQQ